MCLEHNRFNPVLLREMHRRREERRDEERKRNARLALKRHLKLHGFTSIEQDPTLTRVVPTEPLPVRHDLDD